MASDRVARCFADIVAAVDLIRTWVARAGDDEKAILEDALLRSAIERQLLVICEAAIRLDKLDAAAAAALAPGLTGPAFAESAISSATNTTISTLQSWSMSLQTVSRVFGRRPNMRSRRDKQRNNAWAGRLMLRQAQHEDLTKRTSP